ncbi:MAG: phosphotransferase [Gallionella sp.]|nr:phosphotransferase [Gallionella sp.]
MGIIKKIIYRENILGKPRHRSLFLDMEENIHIHYRDLRIELSRGEFEEIAKIFAKQSQELQTIIDEKDYQDGKFANANQDDVRIWTESRLNHDVKYHPQRFSLEECTDGYHLHYRNYKLLIDSAEFRQIAGLFKQLDVDSPYAASYEEVLNLLEANDIDFMLDAGNVPNEILSIAVAQYHYSKTGSILKCVGFSQQSAGEFVGQRLKVKIKADNQHQVADYKRIRAISKTIRLVDHLSSGSLSIDGNELNQINCQIMDLYSAIKAGQKLHVELDHHLWLYSTDSKQVIFPYSPAPCSGPEAAEAMYKAWRMQLEHFKLHFIKPAKLAFPQAAQPVLHARIAETLRKEVASYAAVEKIYLMGSATRGDMGKYLVPFVYGKWVKLGSDVDILVELNPAREADIPGHWTLTNNQPSNHSAIYHVAEIPLAEDTRKWSEQYPNIKFSHHIIDAYVFIPSRQREEEKNEFLRKFNAQLFYDRARDGAISPGEEEERIAARLTELYAMPKVSVEKMHVQTENALYKVFADKHDYILKLFKVSGNYSTTRIAEHVAYEGRLITQLKKRGISTAAVINSNKSPEVTIEGLPAMLFERLSGSAQQRPDYPMDKICAALADIHLTQADKPLKLDKTFAFDDICMIWLPEFHNYLKKPELSTEIVGAFTKLVPIFEPYSHGALRGQLYARSIDVHNHGDVSPKNVIIDSDGQANFFDFNNAFFGSRMADVLDGAFEFSLGEQYIHMADFARFDAFIANYSERYPLTVEERDDLAQWIGLVGLIKFIKEIRVLLQRPGSQLRTKRALLIAQFILLRGDKHC